MTIFHSCTSFYLTFYLRYYFTAFYLTFDLLYFMFFIFEVKLIRHRLRQNICGFCTLSGNNFFGYMNLLLNLSYLWNRFIIIVSRNLPSWSRFPETVPLPAITASRDSTTGRDIFWAEIFKESMGARKRGGRRLSYRRPARYIGWRNSFLGIDSGAPYTFKDTGSGNVYRKCVEPRHFFPWDRNKRWIRLQYWTNASNRHAVLYLTWLSVRYFHGQLRRHSICSQPDVIT